MKNGERCMSVGEMGAEIQHAARKHGATVAVGTAPTGSYGRVAVHFPVGASLAERHEQAKALPYFDVHMTEKNSGGGCTARGMVNMQKAV